MKTSEQIRIEQVEALANVKVYRSDALYLAFIRLLDAMDEEHRDSLLFAPLDDVQRIQGAADQVRKLRTALVERSNHATLT